MGFLDLPEEIIEHILNLLPDTDIKSIVEDKSPQNKVLRQKLILPFEKQILWQRSSSIWVSYQQTLLKKMFTKEAGECWSRLPSISDLKLLTSTTEDRITRLLALGVIAGYEAFHDPYQFKIAVEKLLLAGQEGGYLDYINLCYALLSRIAKFIGDQELYQLYTSRLASLDDFPLRNNRDDFAFLLDVKQSQSYLSSVIKNIDRLSWGCTEPAERNLFLSLSSYMTPDIQAAILDRIKQNQYQGPKAPFMIAALIPYLTPEKMADLFKEMLGLTHKGTDAKNIFIALSPHFFGIISDIDKQTLFNCLLRFLSNRVLEVSLGAQGRLVELFPNDLRKYLLDTRCPLARERRVAALEGIVLNQPHYDMGIIFMLEELEFFVKKIRKGKVKDAVPEWCAVRQILSILGDSLSYFNSYGLRRRFQDCLEGMNRYILLDEKIRRSFGFLELFYVTPKKYQDNSLTIILNHLKSNQYDLITFLMAVDSFQYFSAIRHNIVDPTEITESISALNIAFCVIEDSIYETSIDVVVRALSSAELVLRERVVELLWTCFTDTHYDYNGRRKQRMTQLLIALIPCLNDDIAQEYRRRIVSCIVSCLGHSTLDIKLFGIELLNSLFPQELKENPALLKFDGDILFHGARDIEVIQILTRVYLNINVESVRDEILSCFKEIGERSPTTSQVAYELAQAFSLLGIDHHPIRADLSIKVRAQYDRVDLGRLFDSSDQQYQQRLRLFAPVNVPRPNSFHGLPRP